MPIWFINFNSVGHPEINFHAKIFTVFHKNLKIVKTLFRVVNPVNEMGELVNW
jgi:hypothetical protein